MKAKDDWFKSNIEGKLDNTSLPPKHYLLPLYEAIVNSIQSIEDLKNTNGEIVVQVYREKLLLNQDAREVPHIIGFDISDNGAGFTNDNFTSFTTADSTLKKRYGGKGLGRFVWLKAFDSVSIESHFSAGKTRLCRKFDFLPKHPGIFDFSENPSKNKDNLTTVKLKGLKSPYVERSSRDTTLLVFMVSYLFDYLTSESCPKIVIKDEMSESETDLKEFFKKEIVLSSKPEEFKIKDQKFKINHVLLKNTHIHQHKLCYCADKRVVKEERLDSNRITDLVPEIDQDGAQATYVAYVYSPFLDKAANQERTALNILDDYEIGDEITWKIIGSEVLKKAEGFLAPSLKKSRDVKMELVEKFIKEDGVEFAPLKTLLQIDTVNLEVAKNAKKLDLELHKRRQELEFLAREEGKELLKYVPEENSEEYFQRVDGYFSRIEMLNSSSLVRYVCGRKAILEIFEALLKVQGEGRYALEKAIHNLIYAMGKDSETLEREHNLWIIDERLAFQTYIASDKKLGSMKQKVSGSKEPDIAVFHESYSFTDGLPSDSLTLIEFKRPDRDDYTVQDNPIKQLFDSLDQVLAGKAKTNDGIRIDGVERFYCYIVCTITPSLREVIRRESPLVESPEGGGYFGYYDKYKAYFEVIDYQKLLSDAKKKNRAFFERLKI